MGIRTSKSWVWPLDIPTCSSMLPMLYVNIMLPVSMEIRAHEAVMASLRKAPRCRIISR